MNSQAPDITDAFTSPTIDWWALTPQIILLAVALVVLLITSLVRRPIPAAFSTIATVTAGAATFVVGLVLWFDVRFDGARSTLNGAFGVDGFSLFFTVLTSLGVIATALVAHDYVKRHSLAAPELAALLMTSAVGAIVMASANDLIVLFLGLETLSIALYVMIALHVNRNDARESAIKYFVLGAFSSAFFLYGIALIYGATGTTNLVGIADFFEEFSLLDEQLLLAGVALLLVGFAFKIAAVPFHMWAPDVYQGAPSPITGYLASIAKAAGFAALMRVLFVAFSQHSVSWTPALTGLAFATLVVGSVLAIRQTDVKRMLAFSSISHAGFVLVGVQAASADGAGAALFYLFTYSFMTIGSFAVLSLVRAGSEPELEPAGEPAPAMQAGAAPSDEAAPGDSEQAAASPAATTTATLSAVSRHDLSRYAGLASQRRLLALVFTVFLLAQAGVPLTSGFIGKFQVIAAAVGERGYVLAVVAMLTAVISAFAYLRVVLAMYAPAEPSETEPSETAPDPTFAPLTPLSVRSVLIGCVGITIVAGVIPQFLITFSNDAVFSFPFG